MQCFSYGRPIGGGLKRKWANGSSREKLFPLEPYYNTLEYRRGRPTCCTVCGGKGNVATRRFAYCHWRLSSRVLGGPFKSVASKNNRVPRCFSEEPPLIPFLIDSSRERCRGKLPASDSR